MIDWPQVPSVDVTGVDELRTPTRRARPSTIREEESSVQPPSAEVRTELEAVLEADQQRVGQVYRLTRRGLDAEQIRVELGLERAGFVSNNRSVAKAMLDGELPRGTTTAGQVASSVRGLWRRGPVSPAADTYLTELVDALSIHAGSGASPASSPPRLAPTRASPTTRSLRVQVDDELRRRSKDMVDTIGRETGIETDDYHRVLRAPFALDAVVRLVLEQSTSRTTSALHAARRLDLSLEQHVVTWAADLPLGIDLVDAAVARLDFWRQQ